MFSVFVGVSSIILVVSYPLAKRYTYWPQVVLGLTFNWGALLGWAAATGDISLAPLLLYLAGINWTLVYDTIYAHQVRQKSILFCVDYVYSHIFLTHACQGHIVRTADRSDLFIDPES